MAKTFQEPRPTPVTVISWAWIILGSLMLMSGALGLFVAPLPDPTAIPEDAPFAGMWRYYKLVAVGQSLLAIVGIVAGVRFLRLERWARSALEIASWTLLAGLLAFMIAWIRNTMAMFDEVGGSPHLVFIVAGVMSTVMYGGPIGVMIYHLRSDRVRRAVESDRDLANAEVHPPQ